MVNPKGRKHLFNARGLKKAKKPRRPRKARPIKKPVEKQKQAPEGCEAVRHYGDAWDYEHYEKESLKAQGLYL